MAARTHRLLRIRLVFERDDGMERGHARTKPPTETLRIQREPRNQPFRVIARSHCFSLHGQTAWSAEQSPARPRAGQRAGNQTTCSGLTDTAVPYARRRGRCRWRPTFKPGFDAKLPPIVGCWLAADRLTRDSQAGAAEMTAGASDSLGRAEPHPRASRLPSEAEAFSRWRLGRLCGSVARAGHSLRSYRSCLTRISVVASRLGR